MNKVVFNENLNAKYGETVCVDLDSNILVLCPSTYTLVKTNFDASKILKRISLKEYLTDDSSSNKAATSNNYATTSIDYFQEDVESDIDDESISSSPKIETTNRKKWNLINMCTCANEDIYILADNKSLGINIIICFNKQFEFQYSFNVSNLTDFLIDSRGLGFRRSRQMNRFLKLKLSCFTNEFMETKLYISGNSGVFVYTPKGNFLGVLDITVNENFNYVYFGKIIATKKFTYILCGKPHSLGRLILVYETNIDGIGIRTGVTAKTRTERNYKIIDSTSIKCKSIQTFNGDDLGNCIIIGRGDDDNLTYLYSLNHDGELMYKTKLFSKMILDITVDNVTSRNYRLIAAVKNNKKNSNELMWIYEFENDSDENGDQKIKFQNFPQTSSNASSPF